MASNDVEFVRSIKFNKDVKVQDRHHLNSFEFEDTNADNRKILRQFVLRHPEMGLVAEHDVCLAGSIRRLRCNIHTIEAICKLMPHFSTRDSYSFAIQSLCIDKSALKVVTVLSLAF